MDNPLPYVLNVQISSGQLTVMMAVLIGVILVISALTVALMVFQYYRVRRKKQMEGLYDELITEIALCESAESRTELLSAFPAVSHNGRQWLINKLGAACRGLRGIGYDNLVWLYGALQLERHTIKSLHSRHWHIKARAIQELATFRQVDYIPAISELINSDNAFIRSEAQTAIVKMKGFEGLAYLHNTAHLISEWQQICLLDELHQQQFDTFEPIQPLFYANNVSLIQLALKLTATYRCYELEKEVLACLEHVDTTVRSKAADAADVIIQPHLYDLLMDEPNEPEQVKYHAAI